ncbi:MAG: AbrB/MazE/SpoVT family DNA-binding domain-containing protein [Phascolarctobacterium sp.]|nr:AbrB/MazE/SpoVT family DNA-binding domain-containing protein [Phascolarctobacterium sp.]
MNLAKISANGQITVPVEIRRLLSLSSGDKILFLRNREGEVVLSNASAAVTAIRSVKGAGAPGRTAIGAGKNAPAKKKRILPVKKGKAAGD